MIEHGACSAVELGNPDHLDLRGWLIGTTWSTGEVAAIPYD